MRSPSTPSIVTSSSPFNRILIFLNSLSSEFFFLGLWRNHPGARSVATLVVDLCTVLPLCRVICTLYLVLFKVATKFSLFSKRCLFIRTYRFRKYCLIMPQRWLSLIGSYPHIWMTTPDVKLNFPTNGIHPYFRRVGFRNAWATICDRCNPRKLKLLSAHGMFMYDAAKWARRGENG